MERRSKSFRCSVERLEDKVVPTAGIDPVEVYSWQIINAMRSNPSRFADEIQALHSGAAGTYQGYSASDPVWTELRKDIDTNQGANGWSLAGMLAFLRAQPKLPPLLLQEDLTAQAFNHTEWMKAHGYGHTAQTTRGADLPNFNATTANAPDDWDHDTSKYARTVGENINWGYHTSYAFEAPYVAGTLTRDGYLQRLAYLSTMAYILDTGQPELPHLRNLVGRPDGVPGSLTIFNFDSIGIDQSFMSYRQAEDVPNYFLSTHRFDNVRNNGPGAGQYTGLTFADANRNGLYDIGETYNLRTGQGGGGFSLRQAGDAGLSPSGGRSAFVSQLVRDEVQIYRFVAPANARLVVETSAVAGGRDLDTYLRLFDADGRQIAADDGGADTSSRIDHTFAGAGTHYLGVSGAGNDAYNPFVVGGDTSDQFGDYRLALDLSFPQVPPPPNTNPNPTPGGSNPAPVVPVVVTPPTPPRVLGLQSIRSRRRGLTAIVVLFDGEPDAAQLSDLGAYRLATAVRGRRFRPRPVRLALASYDAGSRSVTLTLARPARAVPLRLTVDVAGSFDSAIVPR